MVKAFMEVMRRTLPPISKTEKEALEAGDSFIESELFQGKLDVTKLIDYPITALTKAEKSFLDNEVETVCGMTDDYQINQDKDLSPEIWEYLKTNGFFGLEVSKKYGGLGFSTRAHSEIIMKLASRSITLGVTVMVPNSIGPAKLLKKYGTQKQRNRYLRRLATGVEFPCFALTSPNAGSDAGSIVDSGVVFEEDGELFIRLNWEKRYITLSPVATLLGLAFKLYDPEGLLGDVEELGISIALVPAALEGVTTGQRHYPCGVAFLNGPTFGRDVVVPIDAIIGGRKSAGDGWRMLMESLAEGRGISLPALSVANMKRSTHIVGGYAKVRKQFNISIGKFEGVQDGLARMAGNAYICDAARLLVSSALDQGVKPAVASAILKYETTERSRVAVNDAMDILGGIGIMEGKNNFMANFYKSLPIGITVEGANILTRSLIMFGQGSVRCHPVIQDEIQSLQESDVGLFKNSIIRHAKYTAENIARAIFHTATFGIYLDGAGDKHSKKYFQKLNLLSIQFAVASDIALLVLGGRLKRKERLSGQFADVLSNMFLAAATLKKYVNDGCREEDLPLLRWAMDDTLGNAKKAFKDVFFKKDDLIDDVAKLIMVSGETRDRLTSGIYTSVDIEDPVGRVERAFLSEQQMYLKDAVKVDYK